MYKVEYNPEVKEDLLKISLPILQEVADYFKKYESEPLKYSSKLYNYGDINLEGYRKTYVANATYRIVIKVENNVAKVVEVVAVGKRENKEIYLEAFNRIKK
ncbi:type II toxin-antitoxin system RelE family toxin [Aliarcobacter butzleri]